MDRSDGTYHSTCISVLQGREKVINESERGREREVCMYIYIYVHMCTLMLYIYVCVCMYRCFWLVLRIPLERGKQKGEKETFRNCQELSFLLFSPPSTGCGVSRQTSLYRWVVVIFGKFLSTFCWECFGQVYSVQV